MSKKYVPPRQSKIGQIIDVVVLLILIIGALRLPLWLDLAGGAKDPKPFNPTATWADLGQDTPEKIAAYNGIANANLIRVGQKIKIPPDTQAAQSFKKGDKVKVLKAVTYTGKAFKTYYDKYDVIEADGDRVVIGIGKTVTAAVNAANLKKA